MPRPGPIPFECVRRSWHSDRHQPVRGSIIQQIFKLVHENHSAGTKKNREWQEKLPVVVLKSEEIMYSKANSEAEYLDHETLWDRMNDAIDTIIRKDETMETGEFLAPCVEASSNLGCVPVRSSRSQRNTNTRNYLSPRNQDSGPNFQKPNFVDRTSTISEANKDVWPNLTVNPPGSSFYPPSFENLPRQMMSFENRTPLVYPLYQGFHFQPRVPQMGFQGAQKNSNKIIAGKPVFQAAREPSSSQMGRPERLFLFDKEDNGSKKESQPKLVECDLSLGLGFVSSDGKELTSVGDVDLDPRSSKTSHRSKEFSFFPLNSEAEEVDNMVKDVRKRKTVGESQHFLHLNPDFERMKRRGGVDGMGGEGCHSFHYVDLLSTSRYRVHPVGCHVMLIHSHPNPLSRPRQMHEAGKGLSFLACNDVCSAFYVILCDLSHLIVDDEIHVFRVYHI